MSVNIILSYSASVGCALGSPLSACIPTDLVADPLTRAAPTQCTPTYMHDSVQLDTVG